MLQLKSPVQDLTLPIVNKSSSVNVNILIDQYINVNISFVSSTKNIHQPYTDQNWLSQGSCWENVCCPVKSWEQW